MTDVQAPKSGTEQSSSQQLPARAAAGGVEMTGYAALSPQQKEQHRIRLGLRLRAILTQFWQEDVSAPVRAMELEGWVDVLEDLTEDEVRNAWAAYQRSGPRSEKGALYRPDAGAIRKLADEARRRKPAKSDTPTADSEDGRLLARVWAQTAERLIRGDYTGQRPPHEVRAATFGYYLHGADERLSRMFMRWRYDNRDKDPTDWLRAQGVDV